MNIWEFLTWKRDNEKTIQIKSVKDYKNNRYAINVTYLDLTDNQTKTIKVWRTNNEKGR